MQAGFKMEILAYYGAETGGKRNEGFQTLSAGGAGSGFWNAVLSSCCQAEDFDKARTVRPSSRRRRLVSELDQAGDEPAQTVLDLFERLNQGS